MNESCDFKDQLAVPNGAFVFCRYSLAVLVWAAFLFRIKELITLSFVILAVSALLRIPRAPLMWVYAHTVERVWPSKPVLLSPAGMRLAHSMGAGFALLCLLFLYWIHEPTGWALTLGYGVVKAVSAVWGCPVYKLYACMKSGDCCTFLKRKPE